MGARNAAAIRSIPLLSPIPSPNGANGESEGCYPHPGKKNTNKSRALNGRTERIVGVDEDFADLVGVFGILAVVGVVALCEEACRRSGGTA